MSVGHISLVTHIAELGLAAFTVSKPTFLSTRKIIRRRFPAERRYLDVSEILFSLHSPLKFVQRFVVVTQKAEVET
jgi:hypothetical protein